MNDALQGITLRCPRCRGELEREAESLRCEPCAARYPVIFGIPDLRLGPDPYLDLAGDREKALRLAEVFAVKDLAGLVEHYWRLTPGTPPELARGFIDQALRGVDRGHDFLDLLGPPPADGPLLEIGCRSGGLLVVARQRGYRALGIDLALRWLVIARKQLEEEDVEAPLIAADAGCLPFADHAFDAVVAEHVLEHTPAPAALLREAHRVLAPGGDFLATTWNRLTPLPEPHVHLFAVGYLPRRLARAYVRKLRRDSYEHVFLRSPFELFRLLRSSPLDGGCLAPTPIGDRRGRRLGGLATRVASRYDRLCERWPGLWPALVTGPVLQLRYRRPDLSEAPDEVKP